VKKLLRQVLCCFFCGLLVFGKINIFAIGYCNINYKNKMFSAHNSFVYQNERNALKVYYNI